METLSHLFDLQEQICYVQCSFCTTILLVSVPLSSMARVVAVKCGHCTALLSVDMLNAFSLPFNLLAALHQTPQEMAQLPPEAHQGGTHNPMEMCVASSDHDQDPQEEEEGEVQEDEDHDHICNIDHAVQKRTTPEKKKRDPSAYNRFIKEEIRRLKAVNPFMTHKQAFSTASKNWAHVPNSLQQEDEDDDDNDNDDDKNPLKRVEPQNSAEMKLSG